jgi:hypothetical protein
MLKPKDPVLTQQMDRVFRRFNAWREADAIRRSEKKERTDGSGLS